MKRITKYCCFLLIWFLIEAKLEDGADFKEQMQLLFDHIASIEASDTITQQEMDMLMSNTTLKSVYFSDLFTYTSDTLYLYATQR